MTHDDAVRARFSETAEGVAAHARNQVGHGAHIFFKTCGSWINASLKQVLGWLRRRLSAIGHEFVAREAKPNTVQQRGTSAQTNCVAAQTKRQERAKLLRL